MHFRERCSQGCFRGAIPERGARAKGTFFQCPTWELSPLELHCKNRTVVQIVQKNCSIEPAEDCS